LLALNIAHALAAIDLNGVGAVPAALLLEGETLGALGLPLHLDALAAKAALALDALDLEGPAAATAAAAAHLEGLAAATAAATAHLEGLAAAATAALDALRLAAAMASATAARPGFGIIVALSTAAGLGGHGGRDRQRRNAGRQE
jgi:hypothetical protein